MDATDEFSQQIDFSDTSKVPVRALYYVGLMLYRGEGVAQNYAEAAKWFQRAGERKFQPGDSSFSYAARKRMAVSVPSSSSFGGIFSVLSSFSSDSVADSYGNSSDSVADSYGNRCIASAQYYLGFMYYHGQGVRQDYAKAGDWFGKAAGAGHKEAQYYLGFMYCHGQGVNQDDKESAKWFGKAARNDHAQAQNALGDAYRSGRGVKQNFQEAVKWYKKADASGIAAAQISLGDMYLGGEGVEKDSGEAMKWYLKAAQQGNADARSKLEQIMGSLLPKNNLVHRG